MPSISVAEEADSELVSAVHRLLPQLSSRAHPPTPEQVAEIVTSGATVLLVARDDTVGPVEGDAGAGPGGPIVGMLTLAVFRLPTGVRARVEDVVVDAAARRRGVAEALTEAAVELASARGAETLDLTTRPSREAANRLYEKVGFERRDTHVYRRRLRKEPEGS